MRSHDGAGETIGSVQHSDLSSSADGSGSQATLVAESPFWRPPAIRLDFLAHHHCPSIGCTSWCLVGGGAGLIDPSWNLGFSIFIMAYPYHRLTRSCGDSSMTLPDIHRLARVDDHGPDKQHGLPNRHAAVPILSAGNHFRPCLGWRRCGTRWQI